MSKLILWGSSALDFYQHGDFTSLLTLWLDIATRRTSPPTLPPFSIWRIAPLAEQAFRIIVPSRQQKRNLKDVRCHVAEASIQQDRYFRIAQGLFAPSPEVAFLQSNWSHDLAEVIFKGSTFAAPTSNASFRHRLPIAPFLLHLSASKKLFWPTGTYEAAP